MYVTRTAVVDTEGLWVVSARSVLSRFTEQIGQIDRGVVKEVCQVVLKKIQQRTASFEEHVRWFLRGCSRDV